MSKTKTPQQIANEAEREAKKLIKGETKPPKAKAPKIPKPKKVNMPKAPKVSKPKKVTLPKPTKTNTKADKRKADNKPTKQATKAKEPKLIIPQTIKNARELEQKKAKARDFIREVEAQGYMVPEHVKSIAFSDTPDHVPTPTLNKYKGYSALNLAYISRNSFLSTDIVYGGGSIYYTEPTETRLSHYDITHGKAQKAINKGLQQKITYKNKDGEEVQRHIRSDQESRFLGDYIKTVTGKDLSALTPGYEDEWIKISTDWDKNKLSLAEYTKLKKTSTDPVAIEQLRRLSSMAYSSYKLYNIYQELADYSRFMQHVNNVNNTKGKEPGVSDYAMEMLSHVLNTSHAWNIAKQTASDSNQVNNNYEELLYMGSKTQSFGSDDLIDEFKQMITNGEPMVNIEIWFDNNISQLTGS